MRITKLCTVVHYLVKGENGVYTEKDATFVGRTPASKIPLPENHVRAGTDYIKKVVEIADSVVNENATFSDLTETENKEKE